MTNLPSKEKVKSEILKELDQRDVPRMCSNCVTWNRANSRCPKHNNMITQSFMTCPGHEFKTEKLEREAMEYLKDEAVECEKIENLLALAITCANLTTCLLEDFENRTKRLHVKETDRRTKLLLRKDLTMGETMIKAFKTIDDLLHKVDSQYRFYVQPEIDRMLTGKDKKCNVEKYDQHLNNSLEFGRLFIQFTRKCIGNKENRDKVFDLLDNMVNDQPYGLTEQDAEHYRLKGFNND